MEKSRMYRSEERRRSGDARRGRMEGESETNGGWANANIKSNISGAVLGAMGSEGVEGGGRSLALTRSLSLSLSPSCSDTIYFLI
jgi:hypothetical protein